MVAKHMKKTERAKVSKQHVTNTTGKIKIIEITEKMITIFSAIY